MAERTIIEVMEDYKDCQRCEDKSCLFPFCNCSKPDSIIQIESELLRTLIADISLDRLEEVCTAEKDGRCMVLPCKVGDRVKVDVRTWGNAWNFKTIENGKFLVGEIISIIKTKKQTLMKIQAEHNVSGKRERKRYTIGALGITVFLTPEEAEAALKEGQR